jgi:molybdate transport system substrate-binding protein
VGALWVCALAATTPAGGSQAASPGQLLVAAAASLSGLADHLTVAFRQETGQGLRFTFAGSNTLARQILEGAPVDVFISADVAQMDAVERAGRLVAGSRVDLLGNQLVVVVPPGASALVVRPDDLAGPAVRRIAMGDPGAVPVGVYGRQWLEDVRLWDRIQPKVVPLPSSPAAMAAVREGRAQAGIVFATDAIGQPVRVAYVVAVQDAPPIVYPAAVIRGGRESEARAFLEFLQRPAARGIFEAAGFRAPGGP